MPQLPVFATIQPVIFVLMFRYVFGGGVSKSLPPGVNYVDHLMPGIFVQTVVFGAIAAAIGSATDMKSGLMERLLRFADVPSRVVDRPDDGGSGSQRLRRDLDDGGRIPGGLADPHERVRTPRVGLFISSRSSRCRCFKKAI